MGTDQYHEPAKELSQKTRTFARMITALTEEAEAIGWYEQRLSLEKDRVARAIMADAQKEEFKHFSMDLEFLLRHKKEWRKILKGIVLVEGDIVKNAEKAEALRSPVPLRSLRSLKFETLGSRKKSCAVRS